MKYTSNILKIQACMLTINICASIVYVYAIAKHKKTRKQVLLRSLNEPSDGLEKRTKIVVEPVSRIKKCKF